MTCNVVQVFLVTLLLIFSPLFLSSLGLLPSSSPYGLLVLTLPLSSSSFPLISSLCLPLFPLFYICKTFSPCHQVLSPSFLTFPSFPPSRPSADVVGGDTLAIVGDGFTRLTPEPVVMVGGETCTITSITDISLDCTVSHESKCESIMAIQASLMYCYEGRCNTRMRKVWFRITRRGKRSHSKAH